MRMLGKRGLFAPLVLLGAFALGACGSDDGGGSSGGGGEAKKGGSITIAQTSQPDYLDPALSYTVNGWEPMWLVYTPPLTYKHAEGKEGATLIPGIAEDMPEISEDGETYTFTIRKGLKFSNGKAVKPSDWEHSIKRVLTLQGGGESYYEAIKGVPAYQEAGKDNADIPGIETNDETGEVKIELTEKDGTFLNVLALNFSGVVPKSTPFENQSKSPPPGAGAYSLTKSVPNREFVLEKNKHFDPALSKDIPEGNLDKITTKIVKSAERQAQDVISGKLDYMQDPPPADLAPEIRSKYKDRYEEHPTVSNYYFFMNVKEKPFDKKEVRQAVNYAIDSPALARLFGGRLEPNCNFLPPDMIGFEKLEPCPYGDPNGPGDVNKAKQLVEQAGETGTKVTVWTNNDENRPEIGQYYTDLLNKIGLEASLKEIDGGVYFATVGNAKTKAQTGFDNWFADFQHPANFMFLIDGSTIQPTNSQNHGNVDDPQINEEIAELKTETEVEAVADRWAAIDKRIIDEAYVAPYGAEKLATFLSERMDFENCSTFHPIYYNDYSSFCLK